MDHDRHLSWFFRAVVSSCPETFTTNGQPRSAVISTDAHQVAFVERSHSSFFFFLDEIHVSYFDDQQVRGRKSSERRDFAPTRSTFQVPRQPFALFRSA